MATHYDGSSEHPNIMFKNINKFAFKDWVSRHMHDLYEVSKICLNRKRFLRPLKNLHYTLTLDNIFIRYGSLLYRQFVCIPMGTYSTSLVADLFSLHYE